MASRAKLKRAVTLPFLIFYGVGTMVGGGFYALLGEISANAGPSMPIAMALAGVLAFLSACSFAELSSRYPVSAGEARYVQEGFGRKHLSAVVGWLVIATGIVSAATLAVATAGFVRDMWPVLPAVPAIIVLVLLLGAVAAWGIGESVTVVVIITVIELAALMYAFGVNAAPLLELPDRWPEMMPGAPGSGGWLGVFGGAFLAFYAFIGFEDMVNIAEEIREPRRALPIAILTSLGLTTLLYVAVSMAAVLSIPVERLAGSATPIAELVRASGNIPMLGVWAVSVLTGINGALVQIIMAARVAYGLSKRDKAPDPLSRVNPGTRTPLLGTALVTAFVLLLATSLPLATLARFTSGIILIVFALVNLALWRVKKSGAHRPGAWLSCPQWMPMLAFGITAAVLVGRIWLAMIGW